MINVTATQLVSIVVPVYNIEKYISSCIDSILSQSYNNIELIIVDDGSTDKSGKICDNYKAGNKNIIVIHKDNSGLSDARNVGISIANGNLIAFVDGDDIIHPLYIESLYNILIEGNADISICPIRTFSDEKRFVRRQFEMVDYRKNVIVFSPELALKEMLFEGRFDVSACGKLYKKELFHGIQYPKGKLFEDLATTYKLIGRANHIAFSPYKLYGYRQRSNSITHVPFHPKMMDIISACEGFCSYVEDYCSDCEKAVAYRRSKTATIILERIVNGDNPLAHNDIARRMQSVIRLNLKNVLTYDKVHILQKIKIICGAYSRLLLKLVCKLYAMLFLFRERFR
jgi:glycosyltransferase involved in cell wall biosynthesis